MKPSELYAEPVKEAIEEIQVVGQRERPADTTSVSPITVVDGDAIAASSATSLDQVLNKLPAFGFQGVNGNQNDGGFGATFVDLRNLNFNRTLVHGQWPTVQSSAASRRTKRST